MKTKLVVLSGSGISAESGISTFRGGNGLWDNVPIEEVCTPGGWLRNPRRVLDFYNERRAQLEKAQPNDAHILLASLEKEYDVNVITQNVDNLHERAGSSKVLHLHGELTKARPEDCYTDADGYSTEYVEKIGYRPIHIGDVGGPHRTQLRPHIVWFEETVPNLTKAAYIVSEADIMLIVGTSLQVYPAATLYRYAKRDCRIYLIDPDDNPAFYLRGVTLIREVATKGMRIFIEDLKSDRTE